LLAKLELEKVTADAVTASANVAAFITSGVKEANPTFVRPKRPTFLGAPVTVR